MLRESTLLSLRSNGNYSFNLDLVAYSATVTESMRRGYICSQSGFRHGCQARRNSLKYTLNPLKEVSGKPKSHSFVRSSYDGISIIPCAFWVLFVERLSIITWSFIWLYTVFRHILVGEEWSSRLTFLFCVFFTLGVIIFTP